MSNPTASQVTRAFLFGSTDLPDDFSSNDLVRPNNDIEGLEAFAFEVDRGVCFSSGAGRFALGSKFALINSFFNYSITIPAGVYNKYEMAVKLGFLTLKPGATAGSLNGDDYVGYIGLTLQQGAYQDTLDDYIDRAYVWGSTKFMLGENAQFVVDASGNRYVNNFVVDTDGNDNFDFDSLNILSTLFNEYAKPSIDPSSIGRKVDLNFTGAVGPGSTYYVNDFLNDLQTESSWTSAPVLGIGAISNINALISILQTDGAIGKVDELDRPIYYGKPEDDEERRSAAVQAARSDSSLDRVLYYQLAPETVQGAEFLVVSDVGWQRNRSKDDGERHRAAHATGDRRPDYPSPVPAHQR